MLVGPRVPTIKRIRAGAAFQRVSYFTTFKHVISSAAFNDVHSVIAGQ